MAPQGQRAHWAASTRSPPALDDASVTALARGLSARFASCSGGSKEVERQQFGYRVTIVQARRSPPDRRGCLRHGGARVRERHAATGCGFRQRSTHKERHEPARMVKRPLTRIAYPRAWVPASPSPHGDRARPFPPTCDHGPPWTLWSHRRPRSQLFASAELALGDARKARLPRVETGAGSPRPEGGLSKLERGGLENVVSSGDRKFESVSLQRRVRLSPGAVVEGREPRLSARLCAVGLATGSAETLRVYR